jgi:DNA-binding NarL/FixJ family response regulator
MKPLHTHPAFSLLTERQREVAVLMLGGLTEREIATRLCISYWTVKEHVRHIYETLGCHNRCQFAALFLSSMDNN